MGPPQPAAPGELADGSASRRMEVFSLELCCLREAGVRDF